EDPQGDSHESVVVADSRGPGGPPPPGHERYDPSFGSESDAASARRELRQLRALAAFPVGDLEDNPDPFRVILERTIARLDRRPVGGLETAREGAVGDAHRLLQAQHLPL